MQVDETPVGDTSGRKCPRAEQNRRRPSDVSELHGGPGSPCVGEMLASPEVTGNGWCSEPCYSPSDCHPAGPAGPYVAGGPVGPDVSFKVLEPLEHSVVDHADQHAAVGTLFLFDCYSVGSVGLCVAGGPAGPDDYLKVLEPLEHSVLDHADPAGQHADVQDTVESLEHFRFLKLSWKVGLWRG